jgi:hypothetical protein
MVCMRAFQLVLRMTFPESMIDVMTSIRGLNEKKWDAIPAGSLDEAPRTCRFLHQMRSILNMTGLSPSEQQETATPFSSK